MSRLGFNRMIRDFDKLEKQFFTDAVKLAKKEFEKNFDTESNSETGAAWKNVKRKVPPKILIETLRLRNEAVNTGNLKLYIHKAVYTIDPADKSGRHYAAYHQHGDGNAPQREFVTQSTDLTDKQSKLLQNLAQKIL